MSLVTVGKVTINLDQVAYFEQALKAAGVPAAVGVEWSEVTVHFADHSFARLVLSQEDSAAFLKAAGVPAIESLKAEAPVKEAKAPAQPVEPSSRHSFPQKKA